MNIAMVMIGRDAFGRGRSRAGGWIMINGPTIRPLVLPELKAGADLFFE